MRRSTRAVVHRRLPPTLKAVDTLCAELRQGLLSVVPKQERFAIELLLREALTNAVVHGAKGEPSGEVECQIKLFRRGIMMHVSDTGDGFDWRARLCATAPTHAESGRGIEILRKYSSRLRFNTKGNGVKVTKVFERELLKEGEVHGRC